MSTRGARLRSALGLLVPLLLASCADVPLVPSDPALSDLLLPTAPDQASGNVVIQYSNQTARTVRWNLAWRLAGSFEPSGSLVLTEPAQAGTIAISGPVELITASAEPIFEDPAATKPAQAWTADPLLLGQDFHPGDIITFTLSAADGDERSLTVQILPGG